VNLPFRQGAKGPKQYRYRLRYRATRDQARFSRRGLPKDKVVATGSPAAGSRIPARGTARSYDLFEYLDSDGQVCRIDSADVNRYIRDAAGANFTAKDFRTRAGTVLAARELYAGGPSTSPMAAKKVVVEAVKCVAKSLGNRPPPVAWFAISRDATGEQQDCCTTPGKSCARGRRNRPGGLSY
jgi:DNA topoisomerase IB